MRYVLAPFPERTIGIDVGDQVCDLCSLDYTGEGVRFAQVKTTQEAIRAHFAQETPARVVLEVGTHSPWMARLLKELGHEVLVANPSRMKEGRKKRGRKKSDRTDAERLARLGRSDPELLCPIEHRSEEDQAALARLRARDALVGSRTALINTVRGQVKALGARLSRCSGPAFSKHVYDELPPLLRPALVPLLETIQVLTVQIRRFDKEIEDALEGNDVAQRLLAIGGVGPLTVYCFLHVIGNPKRFKRSRTVGDYVGLTPRLEESGGRGTGPELSISKAGDEMLRCLLVQCAHYILGPFGADCDLRRFGMRLMRGGQSKRAKNTAVVAVARKLAVLMHHLWVSGQDYEPVHDATRVARETQATRAA
jgi:transposase